MTTATTLRAPSGRSYASPAYGVSGTWRLHGARVATGPANAVRMDIEIAKGRLRLFPPSDRHECAPWPAALRDADHTIDLSGYLILPGLINAHDHLEFSLFPRLGGGPYRNFQEWAADIYHPERSPIKDLLSVPKAVRLWWGAIRNLLCGVTTVCNHNPQVNHHLRKQLPVRVVSRYTWAHSLAFGHRIAHTFRATPANRPFIIHLAEGVDEQSRAEIFQLHQMKSLRSNTVIVHGVGMDDAGHELLERSGSAFVWCPTSNEFLFGRTIDLDFIRRHRRAALASDSPLTAAGDLLDEIQFARRHVQATPEEIYGMVTGRAADVLRLTHGEGTLVNGGVADLIAIADDGGRPCERLTSLSWDKLELVMVSGVPRLLSPRMALRWPGGAVARLERLQVDGADRLIAAPVHKLFATAQSYLGNENRLSGKDIAG